MYKVKRAIILAAGMGSRLNPITLEIPKPLVRVNGIRMIDTVIRSLKENGIDEITIVVGYLKEQFYELQREYDTIRIIENPYFMQCNNISSLYVARDLLSDTFIIDGDQIIYDSSILRPEFEHSGYNAVWTEQATTEWLLTVSDGIVTSCSRDGGKDGWQLYGVSRWNKEDGRKLKKHLELEFEINRNCQIYWDDIALFCYPEDYKLGIVEMKHGDIQEIDSYQELITIDESYLTGAYDEKM